ncbi:hypothetical protein [Ornithinimicrobium murale]|uniref:hypothetical protein n=1 Tax=Ornithinimicrobium murale TaxID=1050153 RepID=UPI000E0D9573|nr:hypothetical protein [Ornithinimicrobium murale]
MTATKAAVGKLREHARARLAECAESAARHNPDCRCGNTAGAMLGWAALTEAPGPKKLERLLQRLTLLMHDLDDKAFGEEASLALAEVIDEGRLVAGQVLLPSGSVVSPVSTSDWSRVAGFRRLASKRCPRCGRDTDTQATWPDCVQHGDHDVWCRFQNGDLCEPCDETAS